MYQYLEPVRMGVSTNAACCIISMQEGAFMHALPCPTQLYIEFYKILTLT